MTKKKIIKRTLLTVFVLLVLIIGILFVNLLIFERNANKISSGNPISEYNINEALLIIDLQESTTGSLSDNQFYQQKSDTLISIVNQICSAFAEKNKAIVYVRNEITDPLINVLNSSYAKGSKGSLHDERLLTSNGFDLTKYRGDAFSNPKLDSLLSANKVNHLFICGLDAAHCVNSTILGAINRKYKISLIDDAVLSKSEAMKDSMLIEFRKKGIEIINSNQILASDNAVIK